MLPDKDTGCHRTFGSIRVRSCHDMVTKHKCQLWVHVEGKNKQTQEPLVKYACLDSLAHHMHLETASTVRETAGEISMHRKENREQSAQAAQNAAALNDNLITMHGQNTQLALAQIRAGVGATRIEHLSAHDETELPVALEHKAQ